MRNFLFNWGIGSGVCSVLKNGKGRENGLWQLAPRFHFLKQDAHHFLQPGGGDDATKEEKMCFSASSQRFYH